jgi:hypothetical protein
VETGAAPAVDFLDLLSRDVFLTWEAVGGVLMVVCWIIVIFKARRQWLKATSFCLKRFSSSGRIWHDGRS